MVSLETFQQFDRNISDALAKAEQQWDSHLNELRNTVLQQHATIGEIKAQITSIVEGQTHLTQQTTFLNNERDLLSGRIDTELESQRTQLGNQIQAQTTMMEDMKQFIRGCDERFTQMHGSVNTDMGHARTAIQALNERMSSGEGTGRPSGGGGSSRSILDPKVIKLDSFSGDKSDKRKFTKWRKGFENHAEHYYKGIKKILESLERGQNEITPELLAKRTADVGLDEFSLNWDIDEVDSDIQTFLEAKTEGDAQSTCEAHGYGGFESYRLMNIEYDPITANSKGALTTNIVSMMKTTASNPKQLKKLVKEFDSRVKAYRMKLGVSPDPALIGSVFTGMLDPETTKMLMQKGIYGDYAESRKTLGTLQVELEDFGGTAPMDISLLCMPCEENEEEPLLASMTFNNGSCNKCTQPAVQGPGKGPSPTDELSNVPAWVLDALGKGGRKGKRTCYNCGGDNHYAQDCTKPYNPTAWRPTKGGNKGGKGDKGGWRQKGAGREGKPGKGGKAYSVTEPQWYPEYTGSLGTCNSIFEKDNESKSDFAHQNPFQPLVQDADEPEHAPETDIQPPKPVVWDPVAKHTTCCLDQTCEYCIRDNHDGWQRPKKKMPPVNKRDKTEKMCWGKFKQVVHEHDEMVQVDDDRRRKDPIDPYLVPTRIG